MKYLKHHVECETTIWVNETRYDLIAKIYHEGDSLYRGHYYTVCKHKHNQHDWWYYNNHIRRPARLSDEANYKNAGVYLCVYDKFIHQNQNIKSMQMHVSIEKM